MHYVFNVFEIALWGALVWLMGGRLGVGDTLQDHSPNPIISQPDWLHITSIRKGLWMPKKAEHLTTFVRAFCFV
jgi:hypothetical protein